MFYPKCSRLIEYDYYYGRYFCIRCGWRSESMINLHEEKCLKCEYGYNRTGVYCGIYPCHLPFEIRGKKNDCKFFRGG